MDTAASNVAEFKRRVEKEWAGDDTAAAWQEYHPQKPGGRVAFAGWRSRRTRMAPVRCGSRSLASL